MHPHQRPTGCPCGCRSSKWVDDPDCIRHTTPLDRYRSKLTVLRTR